MDNCLFCKIIAGTIPSEKVYEDEHIFAFKDIFPKADTHLLIVPKKHIENLANATEKDAHLLSHLTLKLAHIAKTQQLSGFRTIINTGAEGGQEIFHLHYHLLGGKRLPGFK
jgi:histidine triad (HIT) family protein